MISTLTLIGTGSDWFWQALQTVVVTITLFLIYLQIRIQTASHIVSALSTLSARWNCRAMITARLKACESWKDGLKEFDVNAQAIASFFEELAVYHRKGIISAEVLWETYSWFIDYFWAMFKDEIKKMQDDFKDKTIFCEFGKLVDAMKKMNGKKKAPSFDKTEAEIMRFVNAEIVSLQALLLVKD